MDQNSYYLQLQFCGKKKGLSLIFVGIGTCWAPGSQTCKTVMDNGHVIHQLNTLLPAAAGQDMNFCLVVLLGKTECHFKCKTLQKAGTFTTLTTQTILTRVVQQIRTDLKFTDKLRYFD